MKKKNCRTIYSDLSMQTHCNWSCLLKHISGRSTVQYLYSTGTSSWLVTIRDDSWPTTPTTFLLFSAGGAITFPGLKKRSGFLPLPYLCSWAYVPQDVPVIKSASSHARLIGACNKYFHARSSTLVTRLVIFV